jgi:hypothetical protein
MSRILYQPENLFSLLVSAKSTLIGDINNLNGGPARYSIDTGDPLQLTVNGSSRTDSPVAVVVVVKLISPAPSDPGFLLITKAVTATAPATVIELLPDDQGFIFDSTKPRIATIAAFFGANDGEQFMVEIASLSGPAVIDIERIEFMLNFTMNKNIALSYGISVNDLSDVSNSDSGNTSTILRRKKRVLSLSVPPNKENDDILRPGGTGLIKIFSEVGISRPIMVIPREDGSAFAKEISFLGRVRTNEAEISHVENQYYTVGPLTIEEL